MLKSEEEPHNNHETSGRQTKQINQFSLPLQHDCKTRREIKNVLQNIEQLQNPTKGVRKGAKIRNRYNQVPHLTQDTNGKVTNSQLHTTNESQEVSFFSAGDHKAHINRRAQRHSKQRQKTE